MGGPHIVIRSATFPSGLYHFSVITPCDLYAQKAAITLAKQTCHMSHSFNFSLFKCFLLQNKTISDEVIEFYGVFLLLVQRIRHSYCHLKITLFLHHKLFLPVLFPLFIMYAFSCFSIILLYTHVSFSLSPFRVTCFQTLSLMFYK